MSGRDGANTGAYEWQKAFAAADKPTLSSGAFGVLLLLSFYAGKRTGADAFPSEITLAKQSGADRKTVRKALSEAERLGWIKHTNTRRNRVKSWRLTLPPGTESTATEDRSGGGTDPTGRGMDPTGRGMDPTGRGMDPPGRGIDTQPVGESAPMTSVVTSAPTSPIRTSAIRTSAETSPELVLELEASWFEPEVTSDGDEWHGTSGVSEPDYGWAGPRERPKPPVTDEPKRNNKPSWSRG